MIVIAFDFGLKNIGVAVGENILKKGRALSKLSAQNGSPDWDNVKNLLQTWKPKFLVVGLPLNIDGTRQDMTKKAEKFAYSLRYKFNLFVDLHDERLSTKEARSLIFKKNGFKGLKKKKYILLLLSLY